MGNVVTTPEERIRARMARVERGAQRQIRSLAAKQRARRRKKAKVGSVHAISGGLPSLGKRR
jgi:hypothetical protein